MDNQTLKTELEKVYFRLGELINEIQIQPPPMPEMGQMIFDLQFTSGWLSRLNLVGGIEKQGNGLYAQTTKDGKQSMKLTINTSSGAAASYVFVWRQALLVEDEYFFSCKYFIPSGINYTQDSFCHISQWKSVNNDGSGNMRTVALGIENVNGIKKLYLSHRMDAAGNKQSFSSPIAIPLDRWFDLVVYHKKAKDATGGVTVWQDGEKIFDLQNVVTLFGDVWQWSPCFYADKAGISPNPSSIWIADIAINEVI